MAETSNRKPGLKDLSKASRADLEALVTKLVGTGRLDAEVVNGELDSIRETTGERAKAVSEVELSVEQAELLKNLEAQYPEMSAALERYEIPTKGMPTWEQVKKGLTPEVLDKALKLAEPALLLISPTTRQSKVRAIDKHPVKGQEYDTYTDTYEFEDSYLWNKNRNKWRVSIVEGVQDVQDDEAIDHEKKTNYEMSKLWVKKYKDQGLDVINDANTYLTLMMKGLAEGKPVDPNTFTVLNGKNLTKTSQAARGAWHILDVRVALDHVDSADSHYELRLRGSVGVDVPEA